MYEVKLEKAENEHKEPGIVGFFILQYVKLRMLELSYKLFDELCDIDKFEELEMARGSLYFTSAEKELSDCIRREMKAEWERLRSRDCGNSFTADAA